MFITRLSFGVLSLLIGAGVSTAQPSTADTDTPSDNQRTVVIRGCVDGIRLTATDQPSAQTSHLVTTVGARFRVFGDRELLDELRDYSGQEVDLIGIMRGEPDPAGRVGAGRRIGTRTRVWLGGSSVAAPPIPFPQSGDVADLLAVEIRALIPVNPICPI